MKQPGAVERFHREVEAAAKLSHPNIVTAYDADEHQGMHYLVMEYVEGQDLATIVKEHGPLAGPAGGRVHPPGRPRASVCPRARASSTATSSRATCCWTREGTVKILDMGLARIAGAEAALGGAGAADRHRPGDGHLRLHGARAGLGHATRPTTAPTSTRLGCTLYRLLDRPVRPTRARR